MPLITFEYENLGRLQYHERWARSETLRFYLHEALAAQVDARLSSEGRKLVESVLAAALEEEAAGQRRAPRAEASPKRCASPSASSTASYSSWSRVGGPCERAAERVPASAVVRGAPINIYVVLENPLQPLRVGWIWTSWIQLEQSLPSGQLSTSRVRLRRVATVEDALSLWRRVHPTRPCPELKL